MALEWAFLSATLICFKHFMIVFLAVFLVFKYLTISLEISNSPLLLLRSVDCMSWILSFDCSKTSLDVPQMSRSLRDPSKSSSTHFVC
ncbi:hypothetical protein BVRB_9g212890 [Beta vulgaris subsp. vulgaris]|nr:hypothetical protein BVRB_9g212890 [Beta vulgaris subsp. vulgaris]